MNATFWQLFFIVFLLTTNGVLSMSEMAVVSARKARLHQWADQGDKKAGQALALANDPHNFLSTVQVGITLVGVLAGAFSGATISEKFAAFLKTIPAVESYAEAIGLAAVVGSITVLSLIFGELVPKRLALSNPERVARAVAGPMKILSKACLPLVFLLSHATAAILKLARIAESGEPPVTSAEIQVMVEQGAECGVFEEAEQEMVASVLRLDDRKVGALMTPRRDLVWIDQNSDSRELLCQLKAHKHARFPVGDGDLDHLSGRVEARSVWINFAETGATQIVDLVEQPLYVPESTTALDLLELFRTERKTSALILDEYGTLVGLVTQHDLFESIVGEIPPLGQVGKSRAVQRDDGCWLVDGTMPIDAFKDLFEISLLPGEEDGEYQTLAGFIVHQLKRIPDVGEVFSWNDFRFEIVAIDMHRVDTVLVVREQ